MERKKLWAEKISLLTETKKIQKRFFAFSSRLMKEIHLFQELLPIFDCDWLFMDYSESYSQHEKTVGHL